MSGIINKENNLQKNEEHQVKDGNKVNTTRSTSTAASTTCLWVQWVVIAVLVVIIAFLIDLNYSSYNDLTQVMERLKIQTETSKRNEKDLSAAIEKYESCSKEFEFVKSEKAKLEQLLNDERINFTHYKQKYANDLQFCKEKVQDCKSRIKKCAECEKEQLELTKHHYSLLMNLTVQCNIDKAEISSLKAKIEEKEEYAVAKVNEFDKFWKEKQEREDGFINQLFDVKEKLAKCEQEKNTNYEKYSECINKKWFS